MWPGASQGVLPGLGLRLCGWKEGAEVGHLFTLFNLDLSVLPQGHEQIRSAPRTWISFYLRWWLIDRAGMVADSPGM